ncbi:pyridoxal phosphate-dependent transferase [Pestalotiopsis sp. NC0098]|nr:pyridoxal phosphate-dependent transferase [Pestalotiopsis sp. NC0098]
MVGIPPFDVEQWMDTYETWPDVSNIAETCCSSISVDELIQFNAEEGASPPIDFSARLGYGAIRGSDKLRKNVSQLYDGAAAPESVVVFAGAISANYLVFYTLVGPGDHVICVYPTYQQLYTVPETLGAEVSLWKLEAQDNFIPDVKVLEKLVKSNTKMIVINNPNNPTGATIPKSTLEQIVEVARRHDIIVFSDEVYQPLFHSLEGDAPPSVLSLGYDKSVVTGSMSKAWALAGVRLGWVASRDKEMVEAIASARDYTTISVSQLDDQVAAYALSPAVRPNLLSRNLALARKNLAILERFVEAHPRNVSWVKPTAGTTAFVQFKRSEDGEPVDDVAFCLDVLEKTKAFFLPGSKCFGNGKDFKGHVRIGYVNETEVLEKALQALSTYLANI